ncbi:MAG: amidohydrolase [Thermoplasmata archaeon]|nr:amidohydrolase [Thermoplasmata archaeon]
MAQATLWRNGRIFTGRRYVEAVATENGRVVAVGSSREVRAHSPSGAERVDLHGRLTVPGLADSHLHLTELARLTAGVDLHGARSLAEVGRRVRRWGERHPEGSVYGAGWDQDLLRDRRYPTSRDVARWVGDRPTVLFRVCHHAVVVSDSVLTEIDVDEDTPDPPGGRIGRGRNGRANGLLFDNAIERLGPWGERRFVRHPLGLAELLQNAANLGLTSLGPVSSSPEELAALASFGRRRLPVRIAAFLRGTEVERFRALQRSTRTESTRLVGVKVVSDGAFGPRTAWLDRPYRDERATSGFPLLTRSELERVATEADRVGASLAVHAIGDRAIATALDVFEAVRPHRRPRIEHASLTPPRLLDRLGKVRPLLVVQPRFVTSDSWIVERLGPRRARWTYSFATFHARGHRPAASSDAPVEPLDPWTGIAAAIAERRTGVAESVDAPTALRMYGENAAPVLGTPGIGSLEPGSFADVVECDGNDLDRVARAGNSQVLRVWREGIRVDSGRPAGEG